MQPLPAAHTQPCVIKTYSIQVEEKEKNIICRNREASSQPSAGFFFFSLSRETRSTSLVLAVIAHDQPLYLSHSLPNPIIWNLEWAL